MTFELRNYKLRTKLGGYQTDHMPRPGPGIEPGPHWWEASALTTAPSLLPKSNQVEMNHTSYQIVALYSLERRGFLNQINEIVPDFERKT